VKIFDTLFRVTHHGRMIVSVKIRCFRRIVAFISVAFLVAIVFSVRMMYNTIFVLWNREARSARHELKQIRVQRWRRSKWTQELYERDQKHVLTKPCAQGIDFFG
jgi:hypothetical protein